MGSILTALRVKKPTVIFPRKASLGEHRNDHQLATARSFSNVDGVYVAKTQEELFSILNKSNELSAGVLNDSAEYKKLLTGIKSIIA
jgi:UDP-N-acetylglucosamine transferase subunit ALG13